MVLEIVEAQLDDGLSCLDEGKPSLARKKIKAEKEFGSVAAMVEQTMAAMPHGQPNVPKTAPKP